MSCVSFWCIMIIWTTHISTLTHLKNIPFIYSLSMKTMHIHILYSYWRDHHDHMVVGFITTYAINVYHH